MKRLTGFFLRALPQNNQGNWLQAGLIAGAIVFFLLFFLRPFGLGQFEGNIFFVALCFSLLAVAVTWCYGACVFRPWVRRVKTWRVWHECVAILLLLCCISMSNSVVNTLLFHNSLSPQLVLAYLYVTLLFGIPITLTIVALEYQRRLRTRLAELLPKDTSTEKLRRHLLPTRRSCRAPTIAHHADLCPCRCQREEHLPMSSFVHRQPQQHSLRPWQLQRLSAHRWRRTPHSTRIEKLRKDLALVCRLKDRAHCSAPFCSASYNSPPSLPVSPLALPLKARAFLLSHSSLILAFRPDA